MASLTGYLRLRPTRIGFLVRPTDLCNLRKVFQLCSCLWGGMYNPIIPVIDEPTDAWCDGHRRRPSGHKLALGYVRFFEPDVFVETETGLAKSIGVADTPSAQFRPRVVSLDDFASDGDFPAFAFGLDVADVYRERYSTEFQFVHRRDSLVANFEDDDRYGPYLEAAFGGFPKTAALSYIRRGYEDALRPTTLKADPSSWLRVIRERGHTPLSVSCHDLKPLSGSGSDLTIFVVDPTSSWDLLDLWNLRLIRTNVLPINADWMPDLKEYLCGLVARNHRPLRGNPQGLMTYVTVQVGNSFSEMEADRVVRDTFVGLPAESWQLKLWYDRVWETKYDDRGPRLVPVQIQSESSQIELSFSEERRPSIRFQSLSPAFASEHGFGYARWANVLALSDYGNRHRLALALPSTGNSLPCNGINPFLVDRSGFILLHQFKRHLQHMELMTGTDAIIDWFRRHKIDAAQSDAGRVAEQVLSSLGGFSGVWILQDEETLNLLDKMSKSTTKLHGGETIEEYPDRTASVDKWKNTTLPRQDDYSGSTTTLERLVEAGALKLGLSVPCPNCGATNWYGLNDLAERVPCVRCLKQYRFPQGGLDYKRTPWRFRVTGPYSVPNYACGAYATVLALHCLAREPPLGATMTFSTSLDLTVDGEPSEIDFACWLQEESLGYERREDPVFLVGEAKSFARDAFLDKDIARLKRVGERMPGTFIVCATLKTELSQEECNRIRELSIWGREPDLGGHCRNPVIVLTGTELFAQFNMQTAWQESGGQRQNLASAGMGEPWTLADLTQQAYLGLSPTYQWLREYRNRGGQQRGSGADCVGRLPDEKGTAPR